MEICRQTVQKNLKKKNVIFDKNWKKKKSEEKYTKIWRRKVIIHSGQCKRFGLVRCIRGVMFGLARCIRVGTMS